ncbi:peptidoglycan D,D-transpeptidase FtsI family protein [Rubrivivax gelatinosus]|uniref:Peptidoglycan D,D-transpeptidase FtsI n=1 Tax=Rubrivivax gelatinosus (strain NBRC 100245 / IL144) TaxID=983917 RepID=I0HMQ2_RUBGI|nr:penicillin-binding protein 2 [Rubrivivax gelatinosus]MBG6080899.1 cell division protein FtsI (penicillin-binding protein 3) [Rubrivivax gelatinosus]BAL94289.1 peptidoglycan synthetase FtsI [Rubrivivax gelatinosus IL144]
MSSRRKSGGASVRSVNYATSPLLASKTPPWRSRFVVAMVAASFALLLGRAVWVQVVGNDFYQKQGEKRYAHTLSLQASRGRVLDRNGLVLASSVPSPSIWAIPKDLQADAGERRALARVLGITPTELDTRLSGNPNFVWLRRQADDATWDAVKAMGLKGVYQVREYKRSYPEGESAAHVVGFTNVEEHGQEGIELRFDKELQGRDGLRAVVRDRLGRVVEDIGDQTAALDGRDVTLAIDSKVQFFAYQRIRDMVTQQAAKAGSVVVLDAQTGEVLALANYPSYDPGQRRNLSGAQLRNRALTDTFEPGSTMKPFVACLAMETGRVTPSTVIDTAPGSITITGSTIRDSHPHGALTVAQVIQKSSNVGTVKMAMQMQPREMWEVFSGIGIGQRPQIDFPGAVSGRLRPYKTWRPIEQATMSYGYGLSASLLQIARAYTVFARDGDIAPVSILRQDGPVAGVPIFKPETAQTMRAMLSLVTQPGGTAPKAAAIGYSTGGKSGTARKQEGKGYSNKYRAWFVGIAPISAPRIVVAVMVDEPGKGVFYGGDIAGPVFSQVVQNTLRMMGVPPDIPVQAQIVAPVAAEPESF